MNQLDFFYEDNHKTAPAPLADRMRPECLEEFVGQSHLLSEGKILHRLLKSKKMESIIFWGPPGCGKTTLARIVAGHMDCHLISLSAVSAGTKEIRAAVDMAKKVWIQEKKRSCLFMDEIHRLNKAQQDGLLPYVEDGTISLLGATTENPSFEIIRPLLSRTQVLILKPLDYEELKIIIQRALSDKESGLGDFPACLTEEGEHYLIDATGGDSRSLLNVLEIAVMTTMPSEGTTRIIDLKIIEDILQRRAVHYDKTGEEHYNLISALHKSIRGSDPDASLYWLSRMLEGGEDPLYIARRLIRVASEDVGLADPFALMEAISVFQTYTILGSPEGELALAQLVVYLAIAQKSNSVYNAFKEAQYLARETATYPVPFHIRNAPTGLMKELGYGKEYIYPHDSPEGWVPEVYMPEALKCRVFYNPSERGWEGKKKEQLNKRRQEIKKYGEKEKRSSP
ncbi:MAG: replication-associated recombination protein A [Candidatus Eremiobacterota bacterium]